MSRPFLFDFLFHFLPGAVTIACNHVVFQVVVLFVLHLQRFALIVHQLYPDPAVSSIFLGIGGPITNHVLVAYR